MGCCSDPPPLADLLHSPFLRPPLDDCPRQLFRGGSNSTNDGPDALMAARGRKTGLGSGTHRRRRRRKMRKTTLSTLLLASTAVSSVNATFIPFTNCLDDSILNSDPLQLQFIPLMLDASIDSSPASARHLDVTVYGNVSGLATQQPYPPPDDPQWDDPNSSIGKIVDLNEANNKYSTLFAKLNALSFTPYIADPARFCQSVTQGECPLGPVFNVNGSDPSQLRAFSISHNISSAYSFTSLTSDIRVISGNEGESQLACISADITPDLGSTLRSVLRFIPLLILTVVGVATVIAATFCPWGTTDIFKWTTNYGRDEDLLRLVTPGFGDCIQYIQFVVLTGSLTLEYPGFYQPVVSQASWSALMFDRSLVSHENGAQPVQDGIYTVNATYGLEAMGQYVGMAQGEDLWPGMVVWLLGIVGGVSLVIQLGFIIRWLHHKVANIPEEDLQAKNWPFTAGNIVRLVFNFLFLPIVSLSMFQLVIAKSSPVFAVALAVLLLVVLISFMSWVLFLVARTRPRSFLFDDLPTVLLYGPLYNTYTDGAAPFALISVLLTFIRGVAIGAVQPSGIAQVVLLAICEVILILTIAAFRPFHYATSMNSYHTLFSIVRCVTILLSVAWVPSLEVSAAVRGWMGYVILLLHAFVLIFGFFFNAIQTLIEVIARLLGAGGEGGAEGGAARGGLVKVFGKRQLSRRGPRKGHLPHHSINSEAAMLGPEIERPSTQLDGTRPRSLSGSSALLLNRTGGTDSRISAGFESGSLYGTANSRTNGSGRHTPTTVTGAFSAAGHHSGGGGSPRSGVVGLRHAGTGDPYYRPPRHQRAASDLAGTGRHRHGSMASGDWIQQRASNPVDGRATNSNGEVETEIDLADGSGPSGQGTPTPAYLRARGDDPDEVDDLRQPRTDYAVREVDFYYRVRGPALSKAPNRKLKTGPADPTGPVSSATGWLRNLFGGKTKDKGKGFEVVRSTRAGPPGVMPPEGQSEFAEPYHDEPGHTEDIPLAAASGSKDQSGSGEKGTEDQTGASKRSGANHRAAPSLPPIVRSDSIELPSRIGSQKGPQALQRSGTYVPAIPKKSSKRKSTSMGTRELTAISSTTPTQPTTPQTPAAPDREETPTPTNDHLEPGENVFPFSSHTSSTRSDPMSGRSAPSSRHTNDSAPAHGTGHYYNEPGPDSRSGAKSPESPSNVGYVRQHRASDNIHQTSPDHTPLSGSAAEIVKGT